MTSTTNSNDNTQTPSSETIQVPENPTKAELRDSLEQAAFPQASHMAKEIFGEEE